VDRVSSRYAEQIETKATPEDCVRLIGEMFRGYCRLVRSHATGQYSAPVQNALFYMEENLSGDLGLKKLAQVLNLSPGYLSGLFHRETGKTLTRYVNDLRMNHALHLLTTTQLQVQTVAQLCGIPDANYFSKLFHKQFGATPKAYRRHASGQNK
jgi:transcriptional regulator GlxA family with amidase domain